MIQRKQTVFLLLALIATVVSLCLPLGRWELPGMGVEPTLYNLASVDANGAYDFSYCYLFLLLALSSVLSLVTIFLFRNRKLQMTLCKVNLASIVLWYAAFVFFVVFGSEMPFHQQFAAYLPFVAAVFVWLAHRGVVADEKLVRAADRIR